MAILLCLSCTSVLKINAATILTENKIVIQDGYDYELWKSDNIDDTSMTLNEGGTFSCEWNDANIVCFKKGITNPYYSNSDISNVCVDYECTYDLSGNSHLGVYGGGISKNKIALQFYIIDNWEWEHFFLEGKPVATINVDDGTYDVYLIRTKTQASEKIADSLAPAIQYWSVRADKRTSGTISVSEHIREWEKLDMGIQSIYDVSFLFEAYRGSGNAEITKAIVSGFSRNSTTTSAEESTTTAGAIVSSVLESGTLYGDVNCDNIVTPSDILPLIGHFLGAPLTGQAKLNADVVYDGVISVTDLATLKQHSVGDKVTLGSSAPVV